ncbi:MAG: Nitrogen regulatory protein [Verrucomicrobiota bacterium]|jgi:mannitol/fructose-specific phosphotransferase system IIA component (Ntr-type)
MTLASLLSEDQIIPEMAATDRWMAIEEIVTRLVTGGHLDASHRDAAIAALRHREETMSTGIGFGIAIPHASCDAVTEVTACFGRSKAGIDFESLDGKPVHFIVLFLVPKDQFQTHLRTLAAIAKFLNDPAVRTGLAEAPDAKGILAVFDRKRS